MADCGEMAQILLERPRRPHPVLRLLFPCYAPLSPCYARIISLLFSDFVGDDVLVNRLRTNGFIEAETAPRQGEDARNREDQGRSGMEQAFPVNALG